MILYSQVGDWCVEQSAPSASKIILQLKIEAVIFNGLKENIAYSKRGLFLTH